MLLLLNKSQYTIHKYTNRYYYILKNKMNLSQFCQLNGRGTANQLSRHLGIASASVYGWINKNKRVPVTYCIEIEKFSNHQVTCEELRPDIDWAAIRNSQPKVSAVASGQK